MTFITPLITPKDPPSIRSNIKDVLNIIIVTYVIVMLCSVKMTDKNYL